MAGMVAHLDIADFLKQSLGYLTLDVRSEAEFQYAHIPHAVNLPLFNNEERKIVGTLYKQQSKNEAVLAGLEIAGKKMADLVRAVQPLVKDNKIYLHCWRGGMRSSSMAWLLNLFGYQVYVLKGGYKAYRQTVLDTLAFNFRFVVLGGRTGSGKTLILQELMQAGEQVADLEALACHKGSAFGALGHVAQPTTEHFENLLWLQLQKFDTQKIVWLEDESRTIGKIYLDQKFWNNLRSAPLFVVELPVEIRIKKLSEEYGKFDKEELKKSFGKIISRLGNEQWKNAVTALENNDMKQAAKIALYYYDKAYDKGLGRKQTNQIFYFAFEENDYTSIAQVLLKAANQKYGH